MNSFWIWKYRARSSFYFFGFFGSVDFKIGSLEFCFRFRSIELDLLFIFSLDFWNRILRFVNFEIVLSFGFKNIELDFFLFL